MPARQVGTSSAALFSPSGADEDEVTIYNLGPQTIYIEFGAAATVAGGLPIPSNASYTTSAGRVINAICSVLQVTPADTRVSAEGRTV